MSETIVSSIREQGKAILTMMGVAIVSVLAMIVLGFFKDITAYSLTTLAGTVNTTIQATLQLFIVSFGITGSFASITILIIVVKVVIGVVNGLKT